ncbi:hypothetical protein B0A55_01617 [Friedmanniomyces simplex]|uniref:EXPERA domain-containing protein n=1 Tax=Friedmanniomyces simplex TaxID=329884 RepID=A0A4U0XST6_9PEZI|nr:hypothetical protein B0A55_01617 [Friedmanniomyces simplex]
MAILYYIPRLLLTLIALITIIVPYIADFNVTHVYNPEWPGHARFHNGQTMSMGVYLGSMTLWKTWSSTAEQDRLWTATVIAAAYYITQGSAYYYPGATAWDPPQEFSVPHVHLYVVIPILSLVATAYGLEQWRFAGEAGGRQKAL